MSGNGNLGTIGIGPDLFILPSAIHWLIAVQGAVVAWFFFHLVGACIAYSIVATARNKTVDSSESRRLAKEAARSLVDAVVEPVFVLMGYIVQMISFLVSNLGRVVLVVFGCAMAYVVVNYQQQLIVGIDSAYEALYPAFVVPFRRVIDGAVLLYDLWVALHNALHQFLYEFLLNFFKHTLACTGYFSSFFDILGALAQAIAAAVVAVANWLNADLVGQLDFTPAIAQLRLAAYDLLLRVDCACEGNRGLVSVATIGIINDQSTVVDLTLNYGINSILSIPQVLLASIVASTRTNTYDPPDSDYVINQFEGFVSNLGPLLNQLTHNIVTFIENLLNIDDFGFGKINWTPPPFWSIPQQLAMVILETVRIAARCALNINDFFVFGQPQRIRKYALLDATQLFVQANILPDTVFIQNFAVLVPKNVLLPWSLVLSEFSKIPIAVLQVAYELVERVLVGWSVPPGYVANSNGQPNIFNTALFPACIVNTADEQEVFENIWASLWDTATRFNLVVNAVDSATSALGDAIAPYFPPLSPIIQFGANWFIEIYYSIFIKGAYLINSIIQFAPPSATCIESVGRTARVSGDNFVLSIPDFFTFFLDINQAQNAENAHIICKESNTHNFIMTGSLKAYMFASEVSNIYYLDGTPVSCTFYNSYLCPTYTLGYSDFNNNALCNTGDMLAQLYTNTLTTARLTVGFTEAKIVTILACLIAPGDPNTCKSTTSSLQQNVVMLGKQLNDMQTLVVRSANTFVSLFSPLFDMVYKSYFGPDSAMSGAQANEAYNNLLRETPNDLLTYVSIRHGPNSCAGATNAESCAALGENCEWMGTKGGGCYVDTHTHLAYQRYPLETAFVTLLVAVSNNMIFWPQYLAFIHAQRLANAFALTDISVSGITSMLGNIFVTMQEDQYFVILSAVRLGTLAIRDNIIAFVTFLRSFIFVLSRGVLPSQFKSFELAMEELVEFAEVRVLCFTWLHTS